MLIVLDNCEHLIGACAEVANAILLRCPRVHLIATSREPLGIGGETIYRVPSLSLPEPDDGDSFATEKSDAVALFVDRARAQGVEYTLDEETSPLVVSICRRLDGMPLAIELAAARLRSMSLESLNDRLDQRFRLLTGGSRSALPRQQTLRATVEWSYSLLNRSEQSLLRRLSVFAESFDLEAAEKVCCLKTSRRSTSTTCWGHSSTRTSSSQSRAEEGPATGSSKRSDSSQPNASSNRTRSRPPPSARHTPRTTYRSPNSPHRTSLDPNRAGGSHGSTPTRPTCNARMEHATAERDGTERVLRFGAALQRYWRVRGGRNEEAISASHVRARASGSPSGPEAVRRSPGHRRVCLQRYQNGTVGR